MNQRHLFFLPLLAATILLTTAAYYLWGITSVSSVIILCLLIILSLYHFVTLPPRPFATLPLIKYLKFKIYNLKFFLVLIFLGVEATLFTILFLNRTLELMPSPWQAIGPWFFILYALATGLLFFIITKQPTTAPISNSQFPISLIFTSLHLFLTFSVTAILYPLGWGFDAFVHRATEVWIQNHGFISPKQPYYIGQYSLVVWLSNLTGIAIFYLDVYLVPALASLLLPTTIIHTLQRVWNIEPRYSAALVWLIPFVPFLSLHLTTPHNLVLLLSILIVFTTLAYLKDKLPWSIPLLLALAAAATHPLLGAPLLVFVLAALLLCRQSRPSVPPLVGGGEGGVMGRGKTIVLAGTFLTLTILPATLFTLNNLRSGAGWPAFTNPLTRLPEFFSLFARPYWYLAKTPFVYELLYGWQILIVPTVMFLSIIGFYFAYKNRGALRPRLPARQVTPYSLLIFPISALGLVGSSFLLRSWIIFPDVVAYEQGDFPLRLLKASLIFGLPFAMYGLYEVIKINYKKLQKINFNLFQFFLICFISTLLMLSLYLSYPQRNIKARFPGYNVTASDFTAVEWIHDRHNEYDYIVLANQLVSAASLTKYSFAKYFDTPEGQIFYYSVPTGGPQYQEYGRMLYEGQKREYMEAAMERAGVKTGYFVINSYWANSAKIIEGAKKTADSWQVVDGGKVWVFVYNQLQLAT